MRGVSTGSSEYRTDSQVAVYLDDQPMTSISTQVDVRLIDLARIEALPGPQGTLFGSSSQTGTIRYITNKPDPTQFLVAGRCRARHDQGRRGKLRPQRARQYPRDGQHRDPRRRLLLGRRRLRRQRPRFHADGRSGQRRRRREGLERLQDLGRAHRGALADQPGVGIDAEPDLAVQRGRRRLGIGPGTRRLQDHALFRRIPRRQTGTRPRST